MDLRFLTSLDSCRILPPVESCITRKAARRLTDTSRSEKATHKPFVAAEGLYEPVNARKGHP